MGGHSSQKPPSWMMEEWNFFMLAESIGIPAWELAKVPKWWIDRTMFYKTVNAERLSAKTEK